MNAQLIRKTIEDSLLGRASFPQIVGQLIQDGVETYHVDLVRRENRYYSSSGESIVESVNFPQARAADTFSAPQVQAAIKKSQAGQLSYAQFIEEVLNAGCVYYITSLSGKRVTYLGRSGESHVEHFPRQAP